MELDALWEQCKIINAQYSEKEGQMQAKLEIKVYAYLRHDALLS